MDKSFFKRFDIVLALATAVLITIGVLAIYSATFGNASSHDYYMKQLYFALFGYSLMIGLSFIPAEYLSKVSYLLYLITILLLVAVLIFGRTIKGNKSWFYVGGFGIQPSEIAKFTTILCLANYLSANEARDINRPWEFIKAAAIVLIPFGLILKQPDTGTALVFLSFLVPVFFWAGLSPYFLVALISFGVIAFAAFFGTTYFIAAIVIITVSLLLFKRNFIWSGIIIAVNIAIGFSVPKVFSKLQPYQQKRIMAVFDPTTDPLGTGYNVIQSKVAIGSGGLWGKGFLQGTQTQLKFIPEQWTDFIFCMIGEEFGFIGALILLTLYIVIIYKLISNAYVTRSRFLSIACIGFASIILFHLIINVGMTIGLMPVIGIPLPLMSYGISSLLSFLVMLGIGMSAYRNRNLYV
ncbi:MAG: rod shape-determining protein RodA [Ignavibacteria bacterium]|nr:rod shape-determining protein RodA [Ignavibacteria bacterium]